MTFLFNINVCRVCMDNEQTIDLCSDSEIQQMFTYTTRLTFSEKDNLPKSLCSKCVVRLKVANKFIKTAHDSEGNLKKFLAKISDEFKEVTHGKKIDNSTTNENSVVENEDNLIDNDDMMSLIAEENEPSTSKGLAKRNNSSSVKRTEKRKNTQKAKENDSKYVKLENISPAIAAGYNADIETTAELNEDSESYMKINTVYTLDDEIFLIHSENNNIELDNISNFNDQDEQSQDNVEQGENVNEQTMEEEDIIENTHEYLNDSFQLSADNRKQKHSRSKSAKVIPIKEENLNNLHNLTTSPGKKRLESLEDNYNDMQNEGSLSQLGYLQEYEKMLSSNQVNVIQYKDINDLEENSTEEVRSVTATQSEDVDMLCENIEEELSGNNMPVPVAFISAGQKNVNRSKLSPSKEPQLSQKSESLTHLLNRFYCEQCNRDFSTKTNLNRHMQAHEGNKPHTCRECSKSFTQKSSLKQHMLTHTGEKPHICDVCNRGFTQCKSLIFHMRRHTGEKPFQCEYCCTMFRQKDALRADHYVVVSEEMNLFQRCSAKDDGKKSNLTDFAEYNLSYDYLSDMESFVTNGNVTIIMDFPENQPIAMHILKRHVITEQRENGVEILKCIICQTKFATKSEFKMHMKLHTATMESFETITSDSTEQGPFKSIRKQLSVKGEKLDVAIVNASASSAAEPRRAKKFQCRKCFKCFALKRSFIRHMRIHYSTAECLECDLQFTSAEEYQEHLAEQHIVACAQCPDLIFKNMQDLKKHMQQHGIEYKN